MKTGRKIDLIFDWMEVQLEWSEKNLSMSLTRIQVFFFFSFQPVPEAWVSTLSVQIES